ncbi:MAG: hypothetical protein C4542_05465 [Dehalococcoidia bacterium]|nr:MAG: hypothetical protein C4542_05465 [Dehalococcoidia bacterium]
MHLKNILSEKRVENKCLENKTNYTVFHPSIEMEVIPGGVDKVVEKLVDVFELSVENIKRKMNNLPEYDAADELNAVCDIAVVILSAYRALD